MAFNVHPHRSGPLRQRNSPVGNYRNAETGSVQPRYDGMLGRDAGEGSTYEAMKDEVSQYAPSSLQLKNAVMEEQLSGRPKLTLNLRSKYGHDYDTDIYTKHANDKYYAERDQAYRLSAQIRASSRQSGIEPYYKSRSRSRSESKKSHE